MVDRPKKPSAIPVSPHPAYPQVDINHTTEGIVATLPTGESVHVLLYGAAITSWKSNGKENLFLSEKAVLDGSKAVRGGIPLVFPVGLVSVSCYLCAVDVLVGRHWYRHTEGLQSTEFVTVRQEGANELLS